MNTEKKKKINTYALTVSFAMAIVWFCTCFALFLWARADAKQNPVEIRIEGTSSAKHAECTAQGHFAEGIVSLREQGKTVDEVFVMVLARMMSLGVPTIDLSALHEIVEEIWESEAKPHEVGQGVYDACLRGGMI